jgi:hypothetical protein
VAHAASDAAANAAALPRVQIMKKAPDARTLQARAVSLQAGAYTRPLFSST